MYPVCYVKGASHPPKTAFAEGNLVRRAVLFWVWCLQEVSEVFYSTVLSFRTSRFVTAGQTKEKKPG